MFIYTPPAFFTNLFYKQGYNLKVTLRMGMQLVEICCKYSQEYVEICSSPIPYSLQMSKQLTNGARNSYGSLRMKVGVNHVHRQFLRIKTILKLLYTYMHHHKHI